MILEAICMAGPKKLGHQMVISEGDLSYIIIIIIIIIIMMMMMMMMMREIM